MDGPHEKPMKEATAVSRKMERAVFCVGVACCIEYAGSDSATGDD